MKQFKWGIIGLGRIAHKFAQDVSGSKQMKVHAVASRSLERAQEFARLYGATHAFGTYEEIVDADIDAIYIATPHIGHCENTLMCLYAGIPVLCEKPFAMNAEEVDKMISLAQDKEVFLMEALWTRFLPQTKKILEFIEGGLIGDVLSVKADFGFNPPFDPNKRLFNPQLGGGSLLDIGIYPVFLSLLILGRPNRVKAMATFAETGVDIDCGILLGYEGHRTAHLHSTFLAKTKTEAFIYGSLGTIHIQSRWHGPSWFSVVDEEGRTHNYHFECNHNGYLYEAEEVMHCVNKGMLESELMPLSFSSDLMDLLDAVREEAQIHYPLK